MRSAGAYELVLGALLFALGGWLLDGWIGTRPILTCLGAVFGFTAACASLYYRYRNAYAEVVRASFDPGSSPAHDG
jgi:F0F1-type ATP synthase assembly protein I